MEKVIAFDEASASFRVYFPKSELLLAAVRELPVRKFCKLGRDVYWQVGTDAPSAVALARIAFANDFVVSHTAAQRIKDAFTAPATAATVPSLNVTGAFSAGSLITLSVRFSYNEGYVRLIKSVSGSVYAGSTKTWALPVHNGAISVVTHLITECGFTVSVEVVEAIQALLKTSANAGYVEACRALDQALERIAGAVSPITQAASKTMPPLAVIDAKAIAHWVADSTSRADQARALRSAARTTQRAIDRGFEGEAATITPVQVFAVHKNLRALAGVCDGAASQDDVGFSGPDAKVGRSLALLPAIEPIHAAYARHLLRKYSRQLGEDAIKAMG
ncbi:hypothetical protein [Pseudomonas sp. UMAB-40]|uniref:hypothetical protein n=1 Tax=Pseudomonas sp. UMAB-40 TaxID=1365407 RepID=UPI001C58FD7E|nr:hypothetical protein [Pseudomonas sp. UMAB-40]